jgi:hypothetical protein
MLCNLTLSWGRQTDCFLRSGATSVLPGRLIVYAPLLPTPPRVMGSQIDAEISDGLERGAIALVARERRHRAPVRSARGSRAAACGQRRGYGRREPVSHNDVRVGRGFTQ